MLQFYRISSQCVEPIVAYELGSLEEANSIWLDLIAPTEAECLKAQEFMGIEIPTEQSLWEIETSRRLHVVNNVAVMTVLVLAEQVSSKLTSLTLIWRKGKLITLRFQNFPVFEQFLQDTQDPISGYTSPLRVLVGTLENIVENSADCLEHVSHDLDELNHRVFHNQDRQSTRLNTRHLQKLLKRIGRLGSVVSKVQESLVSLHRLLIFMKSLKDQVPEPEVWERFDSVERDAHALTEQAQFLVDNLTFVLDATLGFINLDQNDVIKVLTVLSVAFLPPTLIASIYGMNFQHMPELAQPWGYPLSLAAIVVTGLIPVWFFKRQGWF